MLKRHLININVIFFSFPEKNTCITALVEFSVSLKDSSWGFNYLLFFVKKRVHCQKSM